MALLRRRPQCKQSDDVRPTEDSVALERMGHKQELQRNFSMVSMLGLAFAILNSWTALAASLNLALPSGGPSAVIWGFIVAGICNLALAASLAEFLSAYPTAGGQYHWAAIVSWKRVSRGVSYVTGWISVSGWLALSAAGGLLTSQFIISIMVLLNSSYEAKPWHQFLLYTAVTLISLAINTFLTRLLPYLTKAAFFWSITGFIVISITVLACSSPQYQSASWVYGEFFNRSGWPDGIAWLLGLLQGAFALTGFDATAHMIEEIPEPHVRGPKIMIYCILIGTVSGFIFLSCILFCVADVDEVIVSPRGPLLELFMQATGNAAGSTCLVMFPLICMLFAVTTIMCTSSRMTWAFARDNGLPYSATFAKVHPKLGLPLNSLLWTSAWIIIFGFILLGSSAAFNAITAASVVALGITYAIPPTINCLRLRRALPEDRSFKLTGVTGWVLNMVGIFWTILTTVLFLFPPGIPTTASNMNYCIAAFAIMFLVAGATWVVGGSKHYRGPLVALESAFIDGVDLAHKNNNTSGTSDELEGKMEP
ncbi:hypothetical protein LLEC1_00595 [Akanthomyces lecanii]|uniref:Choline transport protein n=1 Tax=Cordyceps confragosa TaxID=2714763 RepID=A0A179I8H5_CORDF|nr:hypothetical protein LLEC1_00595 [Akanthomyces lecanii]